MALMHIAHTIAGLHTRSGGPTRTVTRLVESLAMEDGVNVTLLSQSLVGDPVFPMSELKTKRHVAMSYSRRAIQFGLPLRKLVIDTVKNDPPQIIHDHGVWLPTNYFVSAIARNNNIPLVIHPRGMLEPWALEYRAKKKILAMFLYQKRILNSAVLFMATSFQEAENLREIGLKQPIAVIPNGVDLPEICTNKPVDGVQEDRKCNALFLSRIHPKKGLLGLVEAWGRVRPENWHLRIAGPDEAGYLAEVLQKIKLLGLESSIEYVGEVEGEAKATLFENADLFILPSYSENFGVVVAEALAYGVPVITTTGTPWQGLLEHRCGWWIEPTIDALTVTLQDAFNVNLSTLKDMGGKGRILAQEYNWQHIAEQTADVYQWILGEKVMPACVLCDQSGD